MRTGVIVKKMGMSHVYDETGKHIPVTVLAFEKPRVVSVRTVEKDGYSAVQLGAGDRKAKRTSKALRNHFAKTKVALAGKVKEFRVSEDCLLNPGDELSVNHYVPGQLVDVSAVSKGKGFAGTIKRHNFSGGRASHGVSLAHRAAGSTGQCQDPGRVFKGKKMAGQMGNKLVSKQNLKIVSVDESESLVLISGAVPGHIGSWVYINDAIKKTDKSNAPKPAGLVEITTNADAKEQAQETVAKAADNAEENTDNNANEQNDNSDNNSVNKEEK